MDVAIEVTQLCNCFSAGVVASFVPLWQLVLLEVDLA